MFQVWITSAIQSGNFYLQTLQLLASTFRAETLDSQYPLVNKQFAIENDHRNSGFTH